MLELQTGAAPGWYLGGFWASELHSSHLHGNLLSTEMSSQLQSCLSEFLVWPVGGLANSHLDFEPSLPFLSESFSTSCNAPRHIMTITVQAVITV